MREKAAISRAKRKLRQGKAPTTAADSAGASLRSTGDFVRDEIHHIRKGTHGARSPEQATAIGLAKARRAGIPLAPPSASRRTRAAAERDYATGQHERRPRATSRHRAQATQRALRHEPHSTASDRARSRQASRAAHRRTRTERSEAARNAARTKGPRMRRQAARKAARTRRRNRSR